MRDLRLTVGDYASPGGGQAPNPCVMGCAHLYLGSLFVFGEGGGGSEGGRVESRLAVSAVLANFRGSTTVDPRSRLTEALEHAGQVLRARSQSATAFQTAWARCIAVLVRRNRLYAARVGDLYLALVRGGDIESVFGESDPAETKQSLLGQPQAVTVQVREAELQLGAGDRFVLSNGALSSAVEESEIGRLASSLVPAVAARRLVEAVDKMARDNPVSVQVVQVGEMPL
ncbi:MAG: serine/threonine protein phosphatase PrpC, partial [Myxococcota bacterium]